MSVGRVEQPQRSLMDPIQLFVELQVLAIDRWFYVRPRLEHLFQFGNVWPQGGRLFRGRQSGFQAGLNEFDERVPRRRFASVRQQGEQFGGVLLAEDAGLAQGFGPEHLKGLAWRKVGGETARALSHD